MTRSKPTPAVDDADLAARLRVSVTRLSRRLRQESTTGLSPSQTSALSAVFNHGPLTLGRLAEHEGVAPPSITKVVDKLEADGLVQRTTDPDDKRVTNVAVTDAGRDLVGEIRRRTTTWLAARVLELSSDERARLAGAIDVLEHLTTIEPPTEADDAPE